MPQNNTATTPTQKHTHQPLFLSLTLTCYIIWLRNYILIIFIKLNARTDLLDWQLQQQEMWHRTSSKRVTFPAVGTLSGAYIWSAVERAVKEFCNFAKFRLTFIDINIHRQLRCSQWKFSQRYEGSNAAHSCTHCKCTKEHHEEVAKCSQYSKSVEATAYARVTLNSSVTQSHYALVIILYLKYFQCQV